MKKTFIYTLTALALIGGSTQALAEEGAKPMHDKAAMFDKLDTDGDGTVSKEEFAAKKKEWKKKKKGNMIKEIDADGDGVISEDEYVSKSRERFSKLDADKDGKVTAEEAEKHHEEMRKKFKEKRKERHEKRDAE